jgi:hypothetical protein
MFKEVTVILFYDGEYIQKLLFSEKKISGGGANPRPLTAFSLSRVGMYVYMTYQFKRNPNTIPVSKII